MKVKMIKVPSPGSGVILPSITLIKKMSGSTAIVMVNTCTERGVVITTGSSDVISLVISVGTDDVIRLVAVASPGVV